MVEVILLTKKANSFSRQLHKIRHIYLRWNVSLIILCTYLHYSLFCRGISHCKITRCGRDHKCEPFKHAKNVMHVMNIVTTIHEAYLPSQTKNTGNMNIPDCILRKEKNWLILYIFSVFLSILV